MGEVVSVLSFFWRNLYHLGYDRGGFNLYFEADLRHAHDLDPRTALAIRQLFEVLGWTEIHPEAVTARVIRTDYRRARDTWNLKRIDQTYGAAIPRLTAYQRVAIDGERADAYQQITGGTSKK
jgi:hypothetical protein